MSNLFDSARKVFVAPVRSAIDEKAMAARAAAFAAANPDAARIARIAKRDASLKSDTIVRDRDGRIWAV